MERSFAWTSQINDSIVQLQNRHEPYEFSCLKRNLSLDNPQFYFDFEHKNTNENLLKEINQILSANPEKIEDFYKIAKALTK